MFDKALKYSYAAQKHERNKFLQVIIVLLILYLLYNTINSFFLSVWVLRNETMQPGLRAGDRFLATSSALPSLIAKIRQTDETPFRRGTIVLINTRRGESQNRFLVITDNLIRFFTAQQAGIFKAEEHIYIKRLIALPGD